MGDDEVKKATRLAPPIDMDEHNRRLKEERDKPTPPPAHDEDDEDEAILSTREVAELIGTTPRLLRKFLRSRASGVVAVGQGNQYGFTRANLKRLEWKFREWDDNRPKRPRKAQ